MLKPTSIRYTVTCRLLLTVQLARARARQVADAGAGGAGPAGHCHCDQECTPARRRAPAEPDRRARHVPPRAQG
eukprot:7288296-Pyramimonas_sp.AAC.1